MSNRSGLLSCPVAFLAPIAMRDVSNCCKLISQPLRPPEFLTIDRGIMGNFRKLRARLGLRKKAESDDDFLNPEFARTRDERRIRVRILGNHSRYHCGSEAVYQSLCHVAQSKNWTVVKAYEPYDVLVVNGEGSMHHSGPFFQRKMKVLEKAVNAGVPAFLVNSVWQDNENTYDDVLRRLSGIYVRESLSRDDLLNRHGVESRVVIDASYFMPLDRSKSGNLPPTGPAITDFYWRESDAFQNSPEILFGARYVPMKGVSWSKTVASLRSADFLVTGRHHAVYAACVAKRPFAASEGNTHKIKGLIAAADVNVPIADSPRDLPRLIEKLPDHESEFRKLFAWMDSQQASDIFPNVGEAIWR
ncbi:polysaccharide pyruvyl transferase family protein [Sinorhizobium sp. BG8]|uniref:polysaccharide pyruvyl transferase family protein n=1 Tax=Sinorhizobium sp. BG8 TaxID=2613773 RepID=UPI00193E6CA1|nr:polysaccharide pyruvyl transferase family protein [Sinorhizobium sp. BG8]QRM56240.1 hypothetical protein F3Y30_18120 [Sinorhizobium sp. BG8]